jgi:hypothetical protein
VQVCANNISTLDAFYDESNNRKRKLCPLAVSKRTYKRCKRTNKIGEIREYWGLKNLSDIVHIPVPFLTDRHLIQYTIQHANIVKPFRKDERLIKLQSIQKFKDVFTEIYKTILQAIKEDNKKE